MAFLGPWKDARPYRSFKGPKTDVFGRFPAPKTHLLGVFRLLKISNIKHIWIQLFLRRKNNMSILYAFLHTTMNRNGIKTTRIITLKPIHVHVWNKGPKNAKKVSFQGPKNAEYRRFLAPENAKKYERFYINTWYTHLHCIRSCLVRSLQLKFVNIEIRLNF